MPPDFSAARGEYVEIMVNNVTVILVLRDTCKINTTIHPLARRVMSEVITIARVYFGAALFPPSTSRLCATKNVRLVDHQHNASCTLPN